jgi:hypothetical protein
MNIRFTLLSVLLLSFLSAFSQQDSMKLNTVIAKTNQVAESRPIEKVYLQLDKPYYAVGDTIWFKGYITFSLHQPSELSKVVYVDVLSSRDSIVKTLILPVTNGTTSGSIPLIKASFKQDNYHIKAYTKWMMNFDQDYFFHKTIPVGSAAEKEVSTQLSVKRGVKNNAPLIIADIIYKDPQGKPFANKKVEWNVTSGLFNAIADGKGTTDQNGLLSINFADSKSSNLIKAVLTTTLDAGKAKTYEQTFSLKAAAFSADVQFFPEGGNLINGINTKVGVKAVQANGLGADFAATVTDNGGNTVGTFTSQHAGMGFFALTPDAAKTYKVNLDFKDGSKGSYDLPQVQAEGFTIAVDYSDTSKVVVRFTADPSYLKKNLNKSFYLVGKSGQIICYAAQTSLKSPVYSATIASNKFPTGIAQFTLLTSGGIPISERIIFIRHHDQLDVTISTDKKSYGPRQKIELGVLTKKNTTAVEADMSISVIDETKVTVDENAESTILSHLLLTSDLKGYIETPNYYFNQVNEKKVADLDLLMLTQGYRRFIYKETLADKTPDVSFLPELGIEITGMLRTRNGMPYKGGRVTIQIPSRFINKETISDVNGKFKFTDLVFTDLTEMVIHAKNNVNSGNLMLSTDGTALSALDKNPNYPDEKLNIDAIMGIYLQNAKKVLENSRVLDEVVVNAKAPVKAPSFVDYPVLNGLNPIDVRAIPGDRLNGCNSVLLCLQGLALGTTYDVETNRFYVSRDFNQGVKVPMAVYVYGVPEEVPYLLNLNPADIASVEVFLKDDLGLINKANNTNGVLVVNMKKEVPMPKGTRVTIDQLKNELPQPHVIKMTANGYSISKQFYNPKYTADNTIFGPDLRSTIYWNPRFSSDATGKAAAEFYSADAKGSYRAVVEGMDKDGHLAYSVYRFKVE